MNVDFDPSAAVNFLRGIVRELREKRLWPVAVALIVAIVAVPLLLSKSASSAPVAQAPQSVPPPSAPAPLPALSVQSTPAQSRLTGRARDPFAQQASGKTSTTAAATSTAATAASAVTTAVAATTGTPASSSSGGASASSSSSGESTTSSTTTPTITYYYDAVDLAFGKFGTPLKTYAKAARLRVFPSVATPVAVYLGLKRDAKTAVFLVSLGAMTSGTGKCIPSASDCAFLDLKVGQDEVILIKKTDGSLVPYQLRVTKVYLVQTSSAAAAARLANARVSRAGRRVVVAAQRSAPDLPWPSYSPSTGFLSVATEQSAHSARLQRDIHSGVTLTSQSG